MSLVHTKAIIMLIEYMYVHTHCIEPSSKDDPKLSGVLKAGLTLTLEKFWGG